MAPTSPFDYTDPASAQAMFEQIGSFDALIAVVGGDSVFKHFEYPDPASVATGPLNAA